MTTPPRNYGQMKPSKPNSANGISNPPSTYPVYTPDRLGNFNSNDLDFAQLFTQLGSPEVNLLHTRSDIDAAAHAQHHTLGTSRNQASPGDHIHDGSSSKLLGNGMGLAISGAQLGNPALASLIAALKNILSITDTTTAGAFDTWHTPPYNTNWAASTTFNGSANWGALQYKKDELNNFYLVGAFKAGTTLPSNPICTFPSGYVPSSQWPIAIMRNNGGVLSFLMGEVSAAGNFSLPSQSGGGIAVSNEYLVASAIFPM